MYGLNEIRYLNKIEAEQLERIKKDGTEKGEDPCKRCPHWSNGTGFGGGCVKHGYCDRGKRATC